MRSKLGSELTNKQLIIFYFLLFTGVIIVVVPFIWMILTSFKTWEETTTVPVVIIPASLYLGAYEMVNDMFDIWRLYFNTISFMALRVLFACLTASMAGYALARLKFPGKTLFFYLVLIQLMVPWQVFVVPQFLMVARMGFLNTIFALVFPGLVTTFGTFLLRQFFMSLPSSIEESAKIDGANPFKIFYRIMLPMVNSGLVAVAIFTALWAFRDLLWPLLVTTDSTRMPLAPALASIIGQSMTYWNRNMAAATLASIPMIIIYIFFQRRFVQGMATSGMKL